METATRDATEIQGDLNDAKESKPTTNSLNKFQEATPKCNRCGGMSHTANIMSADLRINPAISVVRGVASKEFADHNNTRSPAPNHPLRNRYTPLKLEKMKLRNCYRQFRSE